MQKASHLPSPATPPPRLYTRQKAWVGGPRELQEPNPTPGLAGPPPLQQATQTSAGSRPPAFNRSELRRARLPLPHWEPGLSLDLARASRLARRSQPGSLPRRAVWAGSWGRSFSPGRFLLAGIRLLKPLVHFRDN